MKQSAQYITRSFVFLSSFFLSFFCEAGTQAEAVLAESALPSTSAMLVQVGGALVLIVLLIICSGYLAKRFQLTGSSQAANFCVKASIALGRKEKAVLIEINGQQLLLGVTANNINTLHCFGLKDSLETSPSMVEVKHILGNENRHELGSKVSVDSSLNTETLNSERNTQNTPNDFACFLANILSGGRNAEK